MGRAGYSAEPSRGAAEAERAIAAAAETSAVISFELGASALKDILWESLRTVKPWPHLRKKTSSHLNFLYKHT